MNPESNATCPFKMKGQKRILVPLLLLVSSCLAFDSRNSINNVDSGKPTRAGEFLVAGIDTRTSNSHAFLESHDEEAIVMNHSSERMLQHSSACEDAESFLNEGGRVRTCPWVALRPEDRCAKFSEFCPVTCDACPPTKTPTSLPTNNPTTEPTPSPTLDPTMSPTENPTVVASNTPTTEPTLAPTVVASGSPSTTPTIAPTTEPSTEPTPEPTTLAPTMEPTTEKPTTVDTTAEPTGVSTDAPTGAPTLAPVATPTMAPVPLAPMQLYQATTELILRDTPGLLEEVGIFDLFSEITAGFVVGYVEGLGVEEISDVTASVVLFEQERVPDDEVGIRGRTRNRHLQGSSSIPLRVKFYTELNLRLSSSKNVYDGDVLINDAFKSSWQRRSYRDLLFGTEDEFFEDLLSVQFLRGFDGLDDEEKSTGDGGSGIILIVASIAGVVALVSIVAMFLFCRGGSKPTKDGRYASAYASRTSNENIKHATTPSTASGEARELEIQLRQMDDVSTLGDPVYGRNGPPQDQDTVSDETAESMTDNYNFLRLLGKDSLLGGFGLGGGDSSNRLDSSAVTEDQRALEGLQYPADEESFEKLFDEQIFDPYK